MKTKLSLLGLVAAALTTPAMAGDYRAEASYVPQASYNWTGFYFGVQVGGIFNPNDNDGALAFDTDRNGSFNDSIAAFGNNFSNEFDSSISGGVHLGYDMQMDNMVLGFIADYNRTDITQSQSGFSSTPAFYTEDRGIENLATFRGRLGVLATDRALVYLTGGLALADTDYGFRSDTPARVRVRNNVDDIDLGYTVGAGVEYRITEAISLGVEYLFTDFGSEDDFNTNLSGPAAFSGRSGSTNARGADEDFDFSTLQFKLSYRF